MTALETVTVRMSRSHATTPWGFHLTAPHTVCNVVGGSLADRAGIQNGDILVELQGQAVSDERELFRAEHELETSNILELVLQRHSSATAPITRLWKPSIELDNNTEVTRFQHSIHTAPANPPPPVAQPPPPPPPIKVSLEHQPMVEQVPGFNAKPVGFGNVRHLQYNSPMNIYSPTAVAEAYLQQTGGLFGTDPKLNQAKSQQPSYLNSETLRLIQETESKKLARGHTAPPAPAPPPSVTPLRPHAGGASSNMDSLASSQLPVCHTCGRNILGVMCRAGDHLLHSHCFVCSTCGASLNHVGHVFHNDKFYCDVHGRQIRGLAPATMRPEVSMRSPPSAAHPTRLAENVKAFYQPEIMARGPLQPSPTPLSRPHRETMPLMQSLEVETRQSPLPPGIRSATSPRKMIARRALAWPPPSAISASKYWHLELPEARPKSSTISLTEFIKEVDEKRGPPSPKRLLLREEARATRQQPTMQPSPVPQASPRLNREQVRITPTIHVEEEKNLSEQVEALVGEMMPRVPVVLTESEVDDCEFRAPPFDESTTAFLERFDDEESDEMQLMASSDWSDASDEFKLSRHKWQKQTQLTDADDTAVDDRQAAAIERRIDESDKRIAIESIERHQRSLQAQQDQLSVLLDNAIAFLRNLDNELLLKSPSGDNTAASSPRSGPHSPRHYYAGASDRISQKITELQHFNKETISGNRTLTTSSWEHNTNTEQFKQDSGDSRRGQAQLMTEINRVPFCEQCKIQIKGPYVLATGLAWCPDHFTCANTACNRRLLDVGFVEDGGKKYCESCFENLIAPKCNKCFTSITGDCLNALQKSWHPSCFVCTHCMKPFGNSAFYLEQGAPYCEKDWNELFTTKCISCKFPIEAGDRWVEALGSSFHSNCFTCAKCQVNLEGSSFYAKNGLPYCKSHA